MEKTGSSNWFHVPKRNLVYTVIILVLSAMMLSPWAYTTITGGGTSWESIFTIIVSVGSLLLMSVECFRK